MAATYLDGMRVMLEGQEGASYTDILRVARTSEALGFGAFFRSDHWLPIMGDRQLDVPDAWATLAGLARETSYIRLGTLVSPMTFRHPAELAKLSATIDQMSGGRAAWNIVTSLNDSEAANFSRDVHLEHDERYDRADEFVEIAEIITHAKVYVEAARRFLLPPPATPRTVEG